MRIADAQIVQERIGGQHLRRRRKEECGVDEGDHDCDLKEIEKDLELKAGMSIGVRKEKHHQNRCTIETIEEPPYRIRQRVLVKQRVVGLEDCGNEKNH